ncbi:unnamed protein product [Symbiodinium sp. CCMP2456]|nr:unnamed protein product [Symbiodinium sp. CCMP2456]
MREDQRTLWWGREAKEIHCCGSVCCTEIITEDEYVRGYKRQALNYSKQHLERPGHATTLHNEHYDHSSGNQSFAVFEPGEAAGRLRDDDGRAQPLRCGDDNYDWADYTFACQRILEDNAYPSGNPTMRAVHHGEGDPEGLYVTYGLFNQGVHGITRASKDNDAILRYLNNFGQWLGADATLSSISVTRNIGVSVHRDSNKLRGSNNYSTAFGHNGGGDVWLEQDLTEDQVKGKDIVWKRDRANAWVPGRYYGNKENFIDFDPFRRHASGTWTGSRWCITFHTVRGITEVGDELKKYLRRRGRSPRPSTATNRAAPRRGRKSTRNGIMNAAGKISVLMATFLATAATYMSEVQTPAATYDPIVVMEIGGLEGTTEAIELDKVQENAYHFVKGASPRERRIHADEMPERAKDTVRELVREQLDGGGVAVLRGRRAPEIAEDFVDYLEYKSVDAEDGWIVLSKQASGTRTVGGKERPHQVCVVGSWRIWKERREERTFRRILSSVMCPGPMKSLKETYNHPYDG